MGVARVKKLKPQITQKKIEAWLDSDNVPDFIFPNIVEKSSGKVAIRTFQSFV